MASVFHDLLQSDRNEILEFRGYEQTCKSYQVSLFSLDKNIVPAHNFEKDVKYSDSQKICLICALPEDSEYLDQMIE